MVEVNPRNTRKLIEMLRVWTLVKLTALGLRVIKELTDNFWDS